MPVQVVNLPAFITPTTSSTFAGLGTSAGNIQSSTTVFGIGLLDDANSITIFTASTATGLSSGSVIQVSQFDPAIPPPIGVNQSTQWYNYSLTTTAAVASVPLFSSSGVALTISNISFRGIRISMLGSANTAGEVIAWASKQISV